MIFCGTLERGTSRRVSSSCMGPSDSLPPPFKGSGQGYPLLRASDEHSFIVRVLRARRAALATPSPFPSQNSKLPFEEGLGEGHVLLDV